MGNHQRNIPQKDTFLTFLHLKCLKIDGHKHDKFAHTSA